MRTGNLDWQICAQTHDRLGESILWHPMENALYWIDYYGPCVRRQKGAQGTVESWKISSFETIGSLVFADEGLLLAMDHGLQRFDPQTGCSRFFADPKGGRMDLAYNDSKVDRAGRYWVGTLSLNEIDASGSFYRVSPSGEAVVAEQGFIICNGPAFSPDNRRLYFSDSVGQRILCYDLAGDGVISRRRIFYEFSLDEGLPDGLTVDSLGNVWCALYGGGKVVCIDANGALASSLPVPATYPTSLCFGGPDLRTMYVTTGWNTPEEAAKSRDHGGSVFMRQVETPGLPEPIALLAG